MHLFFVFTSVYAPFITFKATKKPSLVLAFLFIQAAGLVYHRRTTCGAYHQGHNVPLYLISPFGAGSPCGLMISSPTGLMIYRNTLRMIYTPYGVIEMRDFGKHLNPLEKYGIIHVKR